MKKVIVNCKTPFKMRETLLKIGCEIILSNEIDGNNSLIKFHPDIQLHVLDKKNIVCAPSCYEYYKSILPNEINIIKGKMEVDVTYPYDCAYNVARVGEYVICNTNTTDKTILDYYKNQKHIIHVNQGYAKCNICIIDENTILTEDIGIHNTIVHSKLQLNSYLIPKGSILLKHFPYGFIGGASGKIENNLFWYGNISTHPSYNTIYDIVNKRGVKMISLSSDPVEDFGSIIFLSE